jgi:hypothetical protein
MIARLIPILAFLAALPVWSQVEPGATGGGGGVGDDSEIMMTPAPASGDSYPMTIGSEAQSNVISIGLNAGGAYENNVVPAESATPVNDTIFSFYPSIEMSRTTVRQQETFHYSPSFIFYQPTNVLDTIDHGATGSFHYRLSPAAAFEASDSFVRTSDVFDQSYIFSQPIVTGSTQILTPTVISPFANQIANVLNTSLSYQFGRNGMVGGGFSYSTLKYPSPIATPGVYPSNGISPNVFYNRRLTRRQYIGLSYQYNHTVAQAVGTQSITQTQSLLPFYALYFTRNFSASITGGIERIDVSLPPSETSEASKTWSPSVNASIGWRNTRGYLAASYARTVTSGEGLFGAFRSNGEAAVGGFRLGRYWNAGLSVSYSSLTNVTPQLTTFTAGNTIYGLVSLSRSIGEHFAINCNYDQLHESYGSRPTPIFDPYAAPCPISSADRGGDDYAGRVGRAKSKRHRYPADSGNYSAPSSAVSLAIVLRLAGGLGIDLGASASL